MIRCYLSNSLKSCRYHFGGKKNSNELIGFSGITKGTTNNRPDRNNNPFNLKIGTAQKYGLTQNWTGVDDENHLVFTSPIDGLNASLQVIDGITKKYPGITIGQLKWAEDKTWNEKVASIAGVDINTPLADIPKGTLAKAIAQQEGFTGKINIG